MSNLVPVDGWYYGTSPRDRQGPVTLVQLQHLVHDRVIGATTQVWAASLPRWIPAWQVPSLGLRDPGDYATGLLVPTGPQSGWAIAAGYCGLLIVVPFLGVLGVVFGILGARDLKRNPAKRGWGRVWTGIILGALSTALYLAVFLAAR